MFSRAKTMMCKGNDRAEEEGKTMRPRSGYSCRLNVSKRLLNLQVPIYRFHTYSKIPIGEHGK